MYVGVERGGEEWGGERLFAASHRRIVQVNETAAICRHNEITEVNRNRAACHTPFAIAPVLSRRDVVAQVVPPVFFGGRPEVSSGFFPRAPKKTKLSSRASVIRARAPESHQQDELSPCHKVAREGSAFCLAILNACSPGDK